MFLIISKPGVGEKKKKEETDRHILPSSTLVVIHTSSGLNDTHPLWGGEIYCTLPKPTN